MGTGSSRATPWEARSRESPDGSRGARPPGSDLRRTCTRRRGRRSRTRLRMRAPWPTPARGGAGRASRRRTRGKPRSAARTWRSCRPRAAPCRAPRRGGSRPTPPHHGRARAPLRFSSGRGRPPRDRRRSRPGARPRGAARTRRHASAARSRSRPVGPSGRTTPLRAPARIPRGTGTRRPRAGTRGSTAPGTASRGVVRASRGVPCQGL